MSRPSTRPWRARAILARVERVPGNVRRREAFTGPTELARFFRGDRLETIPARAADRAAVLAYLAGLFEPGREYPEAQVNLILGRVHRDHASLRRYLIDERLLTRDHGTYRRR
jgi:hypothetical protein